jgi:hypothetical protein
MTQTKALNLTNISSGDIYECNEKLILGILSLSSSLSLYFIVFCPIGIPKTSCVDRSFTYRDDVDYHFALPSCRH